MTPLRLDRAAVHARLDPEMPAWLLNDLLDAFEPALLASMADAPRPTRAPAPAPPKA